MRPNEPNVDPTRSKRSHVVARTKTVGGDVRAQGSEDEREGGEECRCAVLPLDDELGRDHKSRVRAVSSTGVP